MVTEPIALEGLRILPKENRTATTAPGSSDDHTRGYTVGSRWLDTSTGDWFACVDATPGAAVWTRTSLETGDLSPAATEDPVAVSHGGTGSSTASGARTALGAQAQDADLDAVAGLSSTGLIARTGSGSVATRAVAAGAGISVSNGDGVSGDPAVAADVTSVAGKTGAVTVNAADIADSTTTGQNVMTAADQASARGAIGFIDAILNKAAPGPIGGTTPGPVHATTLDATDPASVHGALRKPFYPLGMWARVSDPTNTDTDLKGFYGGFTDGQYGYFVPFNNGSRFGKVARIDLTDFSTVSALDLTNTDADLKGFYGGFTDGRYGYFVPFDNGSPFGKVARVDLTDFSTVSVLDLTNTDAGLKGASKNWPAGLMRLESGLSVA